MKSYPLHSTLEETGLIEQVKVALDENVSSTALTELDDTDTLKLDEIIESKVCDGARLTVMDAPHRMLDSGKDFSTVAVTHNGTHADVSLPDDFLRLVVFKLSDWSYGVTEAISEDSADYLLQSSRWAGVRGNVERPVVAIVHQGSRQVLEAYGSGDGSVVVTRARYIPDPEITTEGAIALCPLLLRATVYRIAELTALAIGDAEAAVSLLKTSNDLLTITNETNG